MNDKMKELARRAVACECWRWMEGMKVSNLFIPDQRAVEIVRGAPVIVFPDGERARLPPETGALPDFNDPATRGCLLELVREVLGDPTITTEYQHDLQQWTIQRPRCTGGFGLFDTEIEAMVTALEAADE